MIQLTGANLKKIEPFFTKWSDTSIKSCLQGCMGTAWADCETDPQSAQILVGDFCCLAGAANQELLHNIFSKKETVFCIAVPEHEQWEALIEHEFGEKAKKITRFATKKERDSFDLSKLKAAAKVEPPYILKMIDAPLYQQAMANQWSRDLCAQFASSEDYQKRGLGAVVLHDGEIVAGASSYTVYLDGIEIEVDTRSDYRRKGLAYACCAKLILECIERGLYPSWDAHNKVSLALAEKLGYHFDKEYTAYEVRR